MNIGCTEKGLKLAIEHAFEIMEEAETQGFDYPIGEIKGRQIRIVWEEEGTTIETTVIPSTDDDGNDQMLFTAVFETEKP